MKRNAITLVCFLVVTAVTWRGVASAQTPSPAQVQQDLQTYDSVFLAGFTLTYDLTTAADPHDPTKGQAISSGTFTSDGTTFVVTESFAYSGVSFGSGPSDPEFAWEYSPPPNRHYSRNGSRRVLLDPLRYAVLEDTNAVQFAPDGTLVSQHPSTMAVFFFTPTDVSKRFAIDRVLFATGRGLASSITVTSTTADGQSNIVQATASGVWGVIPGTWNLTMDTASQYLLRSGAFSDTSGTVRLSLTTSGVLNGGGVPIASGGTVVIDPAEPYITLHSLFKSATVAPDASMIASLKKTVLDPAFPPKGALVTDSTQQQ